MRPTQTKPKTKKPKALPIQTMPIERYFKDKDTIATSLLSLQELQHNQGWHIICSYLKDTKSKLIEELQRLDTAHPQALQTLSKIQDQIKYVDYLLSLPQLIIDSYNQDFGSEILDPYS